MNIFHAGDLNLWHWRQESSLREIEAAEEAFRAACEPIPSGVIDLCMVIRSNGGHRPAPPLSPPDDGTANADPEVS